MVSLIYMRTSDEYGPKIPFWFAFDPFFKLTMK